LWSIKQRDATPSQPETVPGLFRQRGPLEDRIEEILGKVGRGRTDKTKAVFNAVT
jgi:hypothetical protein